MAEISPAENRLLGAAVIVASITPVAVVIAAIVVSAFQMPVTDRFFTGGFVVFIIAAGLQLPLFYIVAELATLVLWWRYVRPFVGP